MQHVAIKLFFIPVIVSLSFLGILTFTMPLSVYWQWGNAITWFFACYIITSSALFYFSTLKNSDWIKHVNHKFNLNKFDLIPPVEQVEKLIKTFCQMTECIETRDQTLLDQKKKAESENKAKSDFLVSMSHELRTPMHAILNFAEMGKKTSFEKAPEKLEKYFSRIEESGDRLLTLIDGLLDLTKLETGKVNFTYSRVDLFECAKYALSELESLLQKKHIQINLNNKLDSNHAIFDKEHIIQVIINLLSNAIKYSPEKGTINITLTNKPLKMSYENTIEGISMEIEDEGSGVPEGELEKIFNKFIQSTDVRPGSGGTGLGLAICKEIITAHHGKIWAENLSKRGAKFTFIIPKNYAKEDENEECA